MKRLVIIMAAGVMSVSDAPVNELGAALHDLTKIVMKEEYIGDKGGVFWGGVKYTFVTGGPRGSAIFIKRGDMLKQGVQAVVDAANDELEPGTGVSGMLHKKVQEYVKKNVNVQPKDIVVEVWQKNKAPIGGKGTFSGGSLRLNVGDAWLNTHQNMRVQEGTNVMRIIHAVGPECGAIFTEYERALLAGAYASVLREVDASKTITSVAIPFLSAGIFGCGFKKAIGVPASVLPEYLVSHPTPQLREVEIIAYQKDATLDKNAHQFQAWFIESLRDWVASKGGRVITDPNVDQKILLLK